MIIQMAKAVPSIEITLNNLFSEIILNACLMYCFIINLCIINYLLLDPNSDCLLSSDFVSIRRQITCQKRNRLIPNATPIKKLSDNEPSVRYRTAIMDGFGFYNSQRKDLSSSSISAAEMESRSALS